MEARIVRDGTPRSDPIPVDELRERLAGLAEWIRVDGVEPTEEELSGLREQLDLHEPAVEDVRHRGQRAKVELHPNHTFAAFRPLTSGSEGLEESELFLIVADRYLANLRFPPVLNLAGAARRWPMLASTAPGAAFYASADEAADDHLEVVEALEVRADELEAEAIGYPLAPGMMAASAVALYLWFKKRGWN
jgi:Mg2+ and Co2+ transporter CorA